MHATRMTLLHTDRPELVEGLTSSVSGHVGFGTLDIF
jgi:hypothetical protein